jgi:hypothetical protein
MPRASDYRLISQTEADNAMDKRKRTNNYLQNIFPETQVFFSWPNGVFSCDFKEGNTLTVNKNSVGKN